MTYDEIVLPESIQSIEGKKDKNILLLTISTCMWCTRAKNWLIEQGFKFNYIDVDIIPKEDMARLAFDFEKLFDIDITYPFIVVNKSKFHIGFDQDQWGKLINE